MPRIPCVAFALCLVSVLTLSACSEETCGVAGTTQACLCTTGAMGAQSCQADGTFSACVCAGPSVDAGAPDSGTTSLDAGTLDAGPLDAGPVPCGADERVVSDACEPCPAGETNAPGDDPAGPNTFCDDACTAAFGLPCDLFEQAYIKASNTGAGDLFGYSVALDGDTLAVGAIEEDSNATGVNGTQSDNSAENSGAVYVFTRTGTAWTQQAYLKASNTGADDNFGISVALDGDTLAVGAYFEASNATGVNGTQDNNSDLASGAVYVFTRTGTAWTQQGYLKASNTGEGDAFGVSVALDGDTLAVGAFGEASNATGVNGTQDNNSALASGAVYVFTRTGTAWTQQAYLKASNTGAGDNFGLSVALDGDTLAVGAYFEASNATGVNGTQDNNSDLASGAVYVFTRTGSAWTQQAYLKASNTDENDEFGFSVALDGDTLAVGAISEASNATGVNGDQDSNDSNAGARSGAVYIFIRTGTAWTQQAYLKASNTGRFDFFGLSVALDGDTLAVGAAGEGSNATGVNGTQSDNSAEDSGAVYVFTRTGSAWTQQAYLKASNTGAGDNFGPSVALDGDTLAVGAIGEASNATGVNGTQSDNSAENSGAVYVRRLAP
jgi:hypothetical protein